MARAVCLPASAHECPPSCHDRFVLALQAASAEAAARSNIVLFMRRA
jgi:hypothetical protein